MGGASAISGWSQGLAFCSLPGCDLPAFKGSVRQSGSVPWAARPCFKCVGLRPKVVLAAFKGNVRQSGGGGREQRGQVGSRARALQGERFVVVIYTGFQRQRRQSGGGAWAARPWVRGERFLAFKVVIYRL